MNTEISAKVEAVASLLNMTAKVVSVNSGHEIYALTSANDPLVQISIRVGVRDNKAQISPIWPRDHFGDYIYIYGNGREAIVKKCAQSIGLSFTKGAAPIAVDIDRRLIEDMLPAVEVYKLVRDEQRASEEECRNRAKRLIMLTGFTEQEADRMSGLADRRGKDMPVEFSRWADQSRYVGGRMSVKVMQGGKSNMFIDDLSEDQTAAVIKLIQSFKK